MKLIIAEKPSLGRSIMSSLGEKFEKHDEYYSSKNYYVVPLHGHILELKDFEDYTENKDKRMWNVKNLPFFPAQYEYNITYGNKKIFDCIKKLLKSPDVTEVIHCGDADREGQIIVDLILEKLGNTKPVTRPFIKSTTNAGLQQAADEGYIANIAVLPAWRRKGWGEALLRYLIDYAREEKLSFLTLEVRRSNLPAQALYRKLGFEVVGVRQHYYARPREDAILMTLFL